jgi:hypothetical protein
VLLWLWLLLCSSAAASSLLFWNLAFSLIPVSLLANLQHHRNVDQLEVH